MKKVFAVTLALLLSLSLIACGNETTSNTESQANGEETYDLTGLWSQYETPYGYYAASISEDGKIGVFFCNPDLGPLVYWIGTYEAPSKKAKKCAWISENTYESNGPISSIEPTTEFIYRNNKILFYVPLDDEEPMLVTLERKDWDTSGILESSFATDSGEQKIISNVELVESAWYVEHGYLYYYVAMHNPNKNIAIRYPQVRITARDAEGVLLGSEIAGASIIYPGKDAHDGFQGFSVDEIPTTVDFEVLDYKEENLKKVTSSDEYIPLQVINTAVRKGKFVGEIVNYNNYDIVQVAVLAVCRDASGKVISVSETFAGELPGNEVLPFSISYYSDADTSNVEYFAEAVFI